MGYLDSEGLAYFWGKVKGHVGVPTKAFTQAEYDALPEVERNATLAIITDAPPGGGASEEIYSTEETRIGTWIDGKQLFQRTFSGVSISGELVLADGIDTLVYASCFVKTNVGGKWFPAPWVTDDKDLGVIKVNLSDSLVLSTLGPWANKNFHATIQYTKITEGESNG